MSCASTKRIFLVSSIAGLLQIFFGSDGWKRMARGFPAFGDSLVTRGVLGEGGECASHTLMGKLALVVIMFCATAFFVWFNEGKSTEVWTAIFSALVYLAINNPASNRMLGTMWEEMFFKPGEGGSKCLDATWMGSGVFALLFGAVMWLILEVSTSCVPGA